ncbi:Protein CBG05236 [Caenorhabditis briggsae]|uniref:Protein CBG05236 n=3 Tax=Caenorhabditis briggsae TaxID=6238 RepID=A8WZG1_CAEBR|nr:Protein CBG05236 [Caenorhabditis briggsae]ULT84177.1 hypothetical protein L3Y34_013072 [Caenorhabditis briggsae]CAP25771.2 Protein CBG05236 [Caenorhabditis briggsae]
MVSSSAMARTYGDKPSTSSMEEDLEIEVSMRNASIIDHQYQSEQHKDHKVLNAFNPTDKTSYSDMIHIDVPDTRTLVERSDGVTKYTAYNIHINGWYHGSVRFSHLYEFAELIKQKFSQRYKGPEFPAKKLFKLDPKAIDERRQKIAKYFQAMVQHPEIARHYIIEKKLLGFQIDSFRATSQYVSLDIYLGNGEKTTIKCLVSDSTMEIMRILAEKLGFHNKDEFIYHFGLFMGKGRDPTVACYSVTPDNFNPLLTRFLRNFESPFVSLSTANQKYNENGHYNFLCIRKLIWDTRIEESILDDGVFVDMIYRQAVQDYKNGNLAPIKDDLEYKMKQCMQRNDKIMFLRNCHLLPTYSYEILSPCSCDYPKPGTPCEIKFGRRQVVLTTQDEFGNPKTSLFRATRIRVWRITQIMEKISFQFEYLMAKDTFEWITLDTDQAILMSLLLQSIGSEILYEHNNMTIEQQVMKEKQSKGNYVEKTSKLPRDPKKPIIVLKNAVEETDPLGVMEHYHNYNRMLTTISDGIPQRNQAFTDITNDDL